MSRLRRFGDINSGNYAIFAYDGELTLHGTARVSKNIWVPAGATNAAGVNPATKGLNGNGFSILSFADNLDKWCQMNLKIPDDMDRSADSTICIGWSSPTTSENAMWGAIHLITAIGDSTDTAGTTTPLGLKMSSATADGLVVSNLITLAGGTIAADAVCIHLQIHRDGSDGDDTLGAVAELHGVAFSYIANALGVAT